GIIQLNGFRFLRQCTLHPCFWFLSIIYPSTSDVNKIGCIHIKNFHVQLEMVRYYGMYSTTNQNSQRMKKAFQRNQVDWLYSPDHHDKRNYYSHWRGAFFRDFGEDPQCCPLCQNEMTVLYYLIDGKKVFDLPPKGFGYKSRHKDFTWDFDEY
ncbi:MAG: hypothetical protein IJ719_12380, partial [Clostridia bacterium]|nr:hypothetical protein [Clostridia bacterium]